MRKSIATVSLSGSLQHKLEAIAAAGFDAIELFENDFLHYPGSARDLRAMAADLGLGIDLYQPFRDFEGMPDDLFARSLERAERKFDVMQDMGCPLLLCCSNTAPQALNDAARSAAQLHELAERAARRGLRVGYEALAWGRYVNLYGQAWSIVQQADHPSLGLILDSFHTLSLGDDPRGIADIPGDKIFFLQMADAPLLHMDVIQWARHHRNFPGQGQLAVDEFFYQTLRAGYRGNLSLEIFNDVFRETPNRRTAVDAMRSLRYLEDTARERLQAEGRADVVSVPLFESQPRQDLGGVAFVEFAVDEHASRSLGALFEAMGFERAGSHRSKKATLYRQGDAALILNAEPGSFARTRFGSFGTSVCAMGILADDPLAAAERAQALCSARFDSPIGPDEMAIPAIVSPGGIVLHFVPRSLGQDGLFAADFVLTGPAQNTHKRAGISGIDHLTLGMTVDQRDTWVLFARAVLGLSPGAATEFADPYGLISSVSAANDSRSLRFVLNVSQSRHTDTARKAAWRCTTSRWAAPTSSPPRRRCRPRACGGWRSRPTTTTTWPRAWTCRPN
ncbi:MAG: 4-hydroxyphenylpyruvate dioxygenase [Paracidovorax wautersii]|uniref:4-hydroxyphenylpyruvate dioxygenase n=1 Tax=Paracidovorax wautersii TaxID=1177982 RepID=A0A7V8FM31_9BURK|nr:MAG: 4-hydroxyphenylpyruvate dioxygenase [Paracidovorax wautersii]